MVYFSIWPQLLIPLFSATPEEQTDTHLSSCSSFLIAVIYLSSRTDTLMMKQDFWGNDLNREGIIIQEKSGDHYSQSSLLIHSLYSTYFDRGAAARVFWTPFSMATLNQLFQGKMKFLITEMSSGSFPKKTCKPLHSFAPFDTQEQQPYSNLPPDVQPSHPVSKSESCYPIKDL